MPKKFSIEEIKRKIKCIGENLEFVRECSSKHKQRKVVVRDRYGEYAVDLSGLLSGRKPSIKTATNKFEYVDKKMKHLQPDLYSQLKILKICNERGNNKKVIVLTEFGKCKVSISSLFAGCKPTIMVALNKNEYYENQAKIVHGNKYSYKEINYKNCLSKIKIWCKRHREYFLQVPYYHLYGAGCNKCGRLFTTEFAKRNPSGWSYKDWESASKRSKYFEGFKVYIIKCWNENEMFFKVGKTYNSLGRRFRESTLMPYKWKLIKEIVGDARTICELENEIKNSNKKNLYSPKISFKGEGECFIKLKTLYK